MKSQEFVTESIKGQGTQALRKVLADFGFQTRGSVYSDKRKGSRRVKALPVIHNPKARDKFKVYTRPTKKQMPSQQEVEASVARHFGSMNVLKVVIHNVDPKARIYNDAPYIAVAYTET